MRSTSAALTAGVEEQYCRSRSSIEACLQDMQSRRHWEAFNRIPHKADGSCRATCWYLERPQVVEPHRVRATSRSSVGRV